MVKKDPPPQKADAPGQKRTISSQWTQFSGSRGIAVDKIATVDKPSAGGGMNIADFASAARARSRSSGGPVGDDALRDFRQTGKWDAKAVIAEFVKEPETDPRAKKKRLRGRDATPESLLAVARANVIAAIWGEVKGVRDLATSVARSEQLDPDQKRRVDGIVRASGTRQLTVQHLRELLPLSCAASGDNEVPVMERAVALLGLRDSLRSFGDVERSVVSPRQLFDVRVQEACLIITDMPARESATSRRGPSFSRVVVLLRDLKGELNLLDGKGLHDPTKGCDDASTHSARMRKPDEMALKEYLGGVRASPPLSPLARLVWDGYLSSTPPKTLANVEINVVRATAFRYC